MSDETPKPPTDAPSDAEIKADGYGMDLLMYGNEQILQGSDTGTLVAFAALAFQQIRGKGEPHQILGCGILLFSVMMCALVHFAIGNAYIGRAKKLLRQRMESRGARLIRRTSHVFAWIAATIQFLCLIAGTALILPEHAPLFVQRHVMPWFGGK